MVREAARYADEVLVVDDASRDGTARVARNAGAKVVRLSTNRGYIGAIKVGFAQAAGDVVVTLDGDGELPASRIPDLTRPVIDGEADMVQGRREEIVRPSERVLTWIANRVAPAGDTGTGMRAIQTELARTLEIPGACICGVLTLEVLSRGGRVSEVPIRLSSVDKPRKIAWYHGRQLFYVLAAVLRLKLSLG